MADEITTTQKKGADPKVCPTAQRANFGKRQFAPIRSYELRDSLFTADDKNLASVVIAY